VWIVDVAVPESPAVRGVYCMSGPAVNDVAVTGDYVLAAREPGRLQIIDAYEPFAPSDIAA
jgi:hypothetical protein